jgi:hypothetical protein
MVSIIDVNAANPHAAAEFVHQIMTDPDSMPPSLQTIDHAGTTVTMDLSAT